MGRLGVRATPAGTGGSVEPSSADASVTAFSHAACSGSTMRGAVSPTGRPNIHSMPIFISDTPMTRMIVPVTTGGKKRSRRLTKGAISTVTMPAPMMAPKIMRAPSTPGLALAIDTIGPTAAKVTPIITGSFTPNHWVAPSDCRIEAMPHTNRSAEIRNATSCGSSFSARPTISGTAMAPAYMTRTCCRPSTKRRGAGSTSSTGCVVAVICSSSMCRPRADGFQSRRQWCRIAVNRRFGYQELFEILARFS